MSSPDTNQPLDASDRVDDAPRFMSTLQAVRVYEQLSKERAYQDRKFGGPTEHPIGAWLAIMQRLTSQALWRLSHTEIAAALHEIRQLTAVGVACLEQYGCPERPTPQQAPDSAEPENLILTPADLHEAAESEPEVEAEPETAGEPQQTGEDPRKYQPMKPRKGPEVEDPRKPQPPKPEPVPEPPISMYVRDEGQPELTEEEQRRIMAQFVREQESALKGISATLMQPDPAPLYALMGTPKHAPETEQDPPGKVWLPTGTSKSAEETEREIERLQARLAYEQLNNELLKAKAQLAEVQLLWLDGWRLSQRHLEALREDFPAAYRRMRHTPNMDRLLEAQRKSWTYMNEHTELCDLGDDPGAKVEPAEKEKV